MRQSLEYNDAENSALPLQE